MAARPAFRQVAGDGGGQVSASIRRALGEYFERKRADTDFVERAQAMVARDAEIVSGQR